MTIPKPPLEQERFRPQAFSDPYLSNVDFNLSTNPNKISKQLIAPISGIMPGLQQTTTTSAPSLSVLSISGLKRMDSDYTTSIFAPTLTFSDYTDLSNAVIALSGSYIITDFVIFNPYIHYYQKTMTSTIGATDLIKIQPSAQIALATQRFNIYSRSYRTY